MKQGTVSILVGCHSPIHSILVLKSWHRLYDSWPEPWQVCCIFLHDIGHIGTNYLTDLTEKRSHWKLGARIASKLFGQKGFDLVAGHDAYSGYPRSLLYKPDKYSWYIAPYWWLLSNTFTEPGINTGLSHKQSVSDFKRQVAQNIESSTFRPTHDIYMDRFNGIEK